MKKSDDEKMAILSKIGLTRKKQTPEFDFREIFLRDKSRFS